MNLSPKRRAFVEEYLRCWNATEAARRAGYSERSANPTGSRLLANDSVKAYIEERLAEKVMGADEALLRLAEQARAEYAAYIMSDGAIDLDRMIADGKGHLIKGTRWSSEGRLIVEFYDAQAALALLGRHHALFTDKIEHDVSIDIAGARDELERRINEYVERSEEE